MYFPKPSFFGSFVEFILFDCRNCFTSKIRDLSEIERGKGCAFEIVFPFSFYFGEGGVIVVVVVVVEVFFNEVLVILFELEDSV